MLTKTEAGYTLSVDEGQSLSFSSKEALVDHLAAAWSEITQHEARVKEEKDKLKVLINEVAEQPQKVTGTLHVEGHETKITLIRGQRAQYLKVPRGEPSLLQRLYEEHDTIRSSISVKFEEKLGAMNKCIENLTERANVGDLDAAEILALINESRTVVPTSPVIKIAKK